MLCRVTCIIVYFGEPWDRAATTSRQSAALLRTGCVSRGLLRHASEPNGYLAHRVPNFFLASSFRMCSNTKVLQGMFPWRSRYPLSRRRMRRAPPTPASKARPAEAEHKPSMDALKGIFTQFPRVAAVFALSGYHQYYYYYYYYYFYCYFLFFFNARTPWWHAVKEPRDQIQVGDQRHQREELPNKHIA